eukprot:gene10364-21624_t
MSSSIVVAFAPVIAVAGFGFITTRPTVSTRFSFLFHRKLESFIPERLVHYITSAGGREFLDLSIGEFVLCLSFLGILAFRFVVFHTEYPDWSAGYSNSGVHARVLRSIGELNFVTYAFILLPVTKHSVWLFLCGLSFERTIKFHRAWGIVLLIVMGIHGFGMWITFATTTADNSDANFQFVLRFQINPKTGWSNLSGLLAFIFAFIGAIAANPYIRRNYFELFKYIHISVVPLTFIFAYLHMPALLRWVLPSVVLIDMGPNSWTHKLSKLSMENSIVSETETSTKTPINDDSNFNTNNTNKYNQLNHTLKKSIINVFIDGPFGNISIPINLYPVLVLIAGGIGATPLLSVLGDILHNSSTSSYKWLKDIKIIFIWTSREIALFQEFIPLLQTAIEKFGPNAIQLYSSVSSSSSLIRDDDRNNQIIIKNGRPDVNIVLAEAINLAKSVKSNDLKKVGVMTCGPESLLDAVSAAVAPMSKDVHLHKELRAKAKALNFIET